MKQLKEFHKNDTIRSMYDECPNKDKGNEGMVCIIPFEQLREEYRKPKYQLFRVKSGFGCQPDTMGNACYGHFCYDNTEGRWERYNFIGVGNEEVQRIGAEMEQKAERKIGELRNIILKLQREIEYLHIFTEMASYFPKPLIASMPKSDTIMIGNPETGETKNLYVYRDVNTNQASMNMLQEDILIAVYRLLGGETQNMFSFKEEILSNKI